MIVFNAKPLSSLSWNLFFSLLIRTYSILWFIPQSLTKCPYCAVHCRSLCYIDLVARYCTSNLKFLSALEMIIRNWEQMWFLSTRTNKIKVKITYVNLREELFCLYNLERFIESEFWKTTGKRKYSQKYGNWSMKVLHCNQISCFEIENVPIEIFILSFQGMHKSTLQLPIFGTANIIQCRVHSFGLGLAWKCWNVHRAAGS
jgi:hypothetical protein